MRARGGMPLPAARHAAIALTLLLAASAADGRAAEPECIAARERFGQMWPAIANAFGMAGVPPGNAPPEIAARERPARDRRRLVRFGVEPNS